MSQIYETFSFTGNICLRATYHGYAMREVSVNSTSLYETN